MLAGASGGGLHRVPIRVRIVFLHVVLVKRKFCKFDKVSMKLDVYIQHLRYFCYLCFSG